jgi:hypothetical protein
LAAPKDTKKRRREEEKGVVPVFAFAPGPREESLSVLCEALKQQVRVDARGSLRTWKSLSAFVHPEWSLIG